MKINMANEDIYDEEEIKEFEEFINDLYSEDFDKLFNKPEAFAVDLFFIYNRCLETLTDSLLDNLLFLMSGCTFEHLNFTNENGEKITENSDQDSVFKALKKDFNESKLKLDKAFLKYLKLIENNPGFSISEFPKNADQEDKDILDKLAKEHLIHRYLSDNERYDMASKRMGKAIARFLLENKLIKKNLGAIFMNI